MEDRPNLLDFGLVNPWDEKKTLSLPTLLLTYHLHWKGFGKITIL